MVLLCQLKTPPGQQMLSSQDWWKCNPSSHIHKIFIIHAKEFVLSPFCELCVLWYGNFFLVINLSLLPASYAKSVVEFNLWGHPLTTLTIFCFFWPPTPHFLPYKSWQKVDIFGLPTYPPPLVNIVKEWPLCTAQVYSS